MILSSVVLSHWQGDGLQILWTVSPIVRSCVSVPLTFLDILVFWWLPESVAVVFMLFTAPAGCVDLLSCSPVLVP
jgi:hypothetical protein